MSELRRHALVAELRNALEEIAQLSERMSAALSAHVLDDARLEKLHAEMNIAKQLASRLRTAIDTLDDGDFTPGS